MTKAALEKSTAALRASKAHAAELAAKVRPLETELARLRGALKVALEEVRHRNAQLAHFQEYARKNREDADAMREVLRSAKAALDAVSARASELTTTKRRKKAVDAISAMLDEWTS